MSLTKDNENIQEKITKEPQDKQNKVQKQLTEVEENAAILKETAEINLELEYDDLRDRALESWYEIREYLDMRGSPVLDRCSFSQLMSFCEIVIEFPKKINPNMSASLSCLADAHQDEYYAMDPY